MKNRLLSAALKLIGVVLFFNLVLITQASAQTRLQNQEADSNQTNLDSDIISWVIVLNKNEINSAKLALSKKLTPPVKNYAKLMLTDHSKNLAKTKSLSKSLKLNDQASNNAIEELKSNGNEEIAELKPLNDHDFNNAYINAMIKDHQAGLSTLKKYINEVKQNSRLYSHLKNTAHHVEQHLEKAKQIQDNLGNNNH